MKNPFRRKKRQRISILGAGSFGTALAITANTNNDVVMWEFDNERAKKLEKTRINDIFLPDLKIPPEIRITSNIKEAASFSDIIIIVVPSHVLRGVIKKIKPYINANKLIISAIKGIETKTLMLPSEIIDSLLPEKKGIVVLSGPSHAEEVAKKVPTTIVASSYTWWHAKRIQRLLSNEWFRIYTNSDIKGVELGGALKNIIAIATGVVDGLGLGDNPRAAIITRGLAEIKRLGVKMGAKKETFSGLAGIGDLIVTCTSKYSRNRYVGTMLARGFKIEEILNEMKQVAEGVNTTKAAIKLAKRYNVEMPITEQVYKIMFEDRDTLYALKSLMNRKLKSERI